MRGHSATVTKAPRQALTAGTDVIAGDLKAGSAPRANPERLPLPLSLALRFNRNGGTDSPAQERCES